MKLLNAGCGTHYASGWVNCDVWQDETTRPDIVVEPGQPYPFDDNTFDAAFLGHVIEHIPWKDVPAFLLDIVRVCKPGAPILIVGPDVHRTIMCWSRGSQPWWMIESVMEHQDCNYQPEREDKVWEGAAHHWNCYEDRVVRLLETVGLGHKSYSDRIPHSSTGKAWHDEATNLTWPVVGYHEWQFAILTHAH